MKHFFKKDKYISKKVLLTMEDFICKRKRRCASFFVASNLQLCAEGSVFLYITSMAYIENI